MSTEKTRPESHDPIREAYRAYYATRNAVPENRPRRTWLIVIASFVLLAGDIVLFLQVPKFAIDAQEAAGCFFVAFCLQASAFCLGVEAISRRIGK